MYSRKKGFVKDSMSERKKRERHVLNTWIEGYRAKS